MKAGKFSGLVLSSFNPANLTAIMSGAEKTPLAVRAAPYSQSVETILNPASDIWGGKPYDFILVWQQPETVIPSYRALMNGADVAASQIADEVDQFADLLSALEARARWVFVCSWAALPNDKGYGLLPMNSLRGIQPALWRMNLRLLDHVTAGKNLFLLDTQKWIEAAGPSAFNPKLQYMSKNPFSNDVALEALKDIQAALLGLTGSSKKLVILDLDDTLWGGIVGDSGWENLRLGGHDPVGESYVHFQETLKALKNRGILLAIVSKNEESIALEAIDKHPEMRLRSSDFAGWRIDWNDKAANIAALAEELNLGLDACVFIDDNPAERARIREELPEVAVPEWPDNKLLYASALARLAYFDAPRISAEDTLRSGGHVKEKQRKELRKKITSTDDWIESLGIRMTIDQLSPANLDRVEQLFNKTNQMNLSSRRLTRGEIESWERSPDNFMWTFSVSDRFGDSGLVGIASAARVKDTLQIVDFILSCRVFGRRIENAMMSTVVLKARELAVKKVRAEYLPTPKNKPTLRFLSDSGLSAEKSGSAFEWGASIPYPLPRGIAIRSAKDAA